MHFYSVKELVEEAEKRSVPISTIAKEMEAKNQEVPLKEVEKRMLLQWQVMKEAAETGLMKPKRSMGGLIGGEGKLLEDYRLKNKTLAGQTISKAVSRALAVAEVNASMGKIVAAPTAGSCGILPGVFLTVQEELNLSDEVMANGLFTASAFGIIIAQKASISGAEGGCQAECGAAGAMAGAALVELAGGTPTQAGEACAFVLKTF